jgi:hypothetical protein
MTESEEQAIRDLYKAMAMACWQIVHERQQEEAERDARPRP